MDRSEWDFRTQWALEKIRTAGGELGEKPSPHYEAAQNGFVYEGNRAIITLLSAILVQLVNLEHRLERGPLDA